VVGRRHGDAAGPDPLESRVTVEERSVLGIYIYEVKGPRVPGKGGFDAAEEAAEDGQLKGVKEEGQGGFRGQRVA